MWGRRYVLRRATVMRTKILSVTPVNPLGVTAPLTSKGSRENCVNAMPCRRYNPSVFSACKTSRKASSPYTGEPSACHRLCLANRSVRCRAVHRFGVVCYSTFRIPNCLELFINGHRRHSVQRKICEMPRKGFVIRLGAYHGGIVAAQLQRRNKEPQAAAFAFPLKQSAQA